jgi:hypothetical protein
MRTDSFFLVLFFLVSLQICGQPNRFNIDIEIPNSIYSSPDFKLGLLKKDVPSEPVRITDSNKSSKSIKFYSFYYVFVNGLTQIDSLKFTQNDKIGVKGKQRAVVNIGLYGVDPTDLKQRNILCSPKNNNEEYNSGELIRELIEKGKLIDNHSNKDLKLIKVNVMDDYESPKLYLKDQGLTIHSRVVYIIWNVKKYPQPPEIARSFKEDCEILRLKPGKEKTKKKAIATKSKTVNKGLAVTTSPNLDNDSALKVQIKNYLDGEGYKILNADFIIEPERDAIKLSNIKTSRSLDPGEYKIPLDFNYVHIKLEQSKKNRRCPDFDDREFDLIKEFVEGKIVFIVCDRTSNSDPYIRYYKSEKRLEYPTLYTSDPQEIKAVSLVEDIFQVNSDDVWYEKKSNKLHVPVSWIKKPLVLNFYDQKGNELTNIENKLSVSVSFGKHKIKEFEHTCEIPDLFAHEDISYKLKVKHPDFHNPSRNFIIVGLKDFENGKDIKLEPYMVEYLISFKESKEYKHRVHLPVDTSVIAYRHQLPIEYKLPQGYDKYWVIDSKRGKTILDRELEGRNVIERDLLIKRRVREQTYAISLTGEQPEGKVMFDFIAFNPDESGEKLIDVRGRNELSFTLDFPDEPAPGDSLRVVLTKPLGYNIVMDWHSPKENWKDPKLLVPLAGKDEPRLHFDKLRPFVVFYVDVSVTKDKPGFRKLLENKINKLVDQDGDYVIFISNNENPFVISSDADYREALRLIPQLYPSTPNAIQDREKLNTYIPKNRREINLCFLLSNSIYNHSRNDLIDELVIELFGFIGKGKNLNEVLQAVNRRNKKNLFVEIFTSDKSEHVDEPNYKVNVQ